MRKGLNHTAPCAVKRAGIADESGLDRHSPTARQQRALEGILKKRTAGLRAYLEKSGGSPNFPLSVFRIWAAN
jgi:hypothetical protein